MTVKFILDIEKEIDIYDTLHLQVGKVSQRLDPDMLMRVKVEVEVPSKHVDSQVYWMLAINETRTNSIRRLKRGGLLVWLIKLQKECLKNLIFGVKMRKLEIRS